MSEINLIQQLFAIELIDIKKTIIVVLVLVLSYLTVKKLISELFLQLNVETGKMKEKRERKELINRLETIEIQREKDVEQSMIHDKRIQNGVDELTVLLKEHAMKDDERTIASFRSTLWSIYDDFTTRGYITKEGLKTFMECGKIYERAGGDDIYHDKLEPEVLALPVRDK